MRVDTLFYNGFFFVPSHKKVNWLGVQGDQIFALGTGMPDRHLLYRKKINLEWKRVVPGWIDAHAHLMLLGSRKFEVDVSQCFSWKVLKKTLLERKTREGWIEAYGFDSEKWKEPHPLTASALDQISLRTPLLIRQKDEHALWANSCLLKKARLEKQYLSGYVRDKAMDSIFKLRPRLSRQKVKEALLDAQQACVREGITSVHDLSMQAYPLQVLMELMQAQDYSLRVYAALYGKEALQKFSIPRLHLFHHHLTIRAQKFFIDGALGSRGAWLSKPYHDQPQWRGECLWKEKELLKAIHKAFQNKFQLIFHTLGDQASLWLLKLLDSNYAPHKLRPQRIRLEHVEVLNQKSLSFMKRLGVIASMQPWHALSDSPWLGSRLGSQRLSQVGRFKDIVSRGIPLCGGSDAPIEPNSPLLGMGAAMTRGKQRLTLSQAIDMYTMGGAYAEFSENMKGSLEVGKLADFVVLSHDIFKMPPRDFLKVNVLMTVIGGKVVYAH